MNDPVVLLATATSTAVGGIVTGYTWSLEGDGGVLTASNVRTSLNSQLLVVEPGSVFAAKTARFRVTAVDSQTQRGHAEVLLQVNVPPLGGTLKVTSLSSLTAKPVC